MEDGKVALFDFGIVGRLTEENRGVIADTFLALVDQDYDSLVRQYIMMGFITEQIDLDKFKRGFKADLLELIDPLYTKTLGEIKISDYLERITSIAVKHGLKFPRELILMDKALLIVEGLGRELDPGFDLIAAAKPYATKLVRMKYSPRSVARRARKHTEELAEFLEGFPRQVRVVMRKVINDDMKMKMEVKNLDTFIRDFDRSTNRLSFALIIAGITIASSVIIHAGKGRMMFGYPFLGLFGYVLAAVLGLWLVWGIIRSGRL